MGGWNGGYRPRLPPPESEETIFRKYDKTAYGDDHPNKNHPVFQLCSKAQISTNEDILSTFLFCFQIFLKTK